MRVKHIGSNEDPGTKVSAGKSGRSSVKSFLLLSVTFLKGSLAGRFEVKRSGMMHLGFGLGCSAEGRVTGNQCPYKEREKKKKRVRECEQRVKVDRVYLNAFPYQRVTPSQGEPSRKLHNWPAAESRGACSVNRGRLSPDRREKLLTSRMNDHGVTSQAPLSLS